MICRRDMVWLLLVIQAWRIGIPTVRLIAVEDERERFGVTGIIDLFPFRTFERRRVNATVAPFVTSTATVVCGGLQGEDAVTVCIGAHHACRPGTDDKLRLVAIDPQTLPHC